MSDEEYSDLFDAEPAYDYKHVSQREDNFAGFKTITISDNVNVTLPADLWLLIFSIVSEKPHQVWWRILSEVSKHINHSLKFYFKHIQFDRYNSSATIAEYLASEGYLNCLQYVHENGARWDVTTCIKAAQNGHLSCLKYAHENGCEWNEVTCYYSAHNGQIDCLKYAHEEGCEWDCTTIFAAAKNDQLECLKYCYENDCPRKPPNLYYTYSDQNIMSAAAGNGSYNCLKYLHEQGEPWKENVLAVMAKFGHLDCIKYAIEKGCTYDDQRICSYASDDLECLKYFHEKGHPWGRASIDAAREDNIDCLKYIHEHGGSWLGDEIIEAYRFGSLECLKYVFENGCPIPPDLCNRQDYYTSREVIDYVHSKIECTCFE